VPQSRAFSRSVNNEHAYLARVDLKRAIPGATAFSYFKLRNLDRPGNISFKSESYVCTRADERYEIPRVQLCCPLH
jgi:hypothetical protein